MKQIKLSIKRKSITLIEVVLDAAILSALSVIVLLSLLASVRTVTHSATVSTAAQLANEQIETLRNYSYNDLATQNGAIFPPGNIPDQQTLVKDKKSLIVLTDIRYIDDPYDGQAGEITNDLNPADYKRITVTVKSSGSDEVLASLSTDIASRAAETSSNTGVLKITVLNADGVGVPDAAVAVTNTTTSPHVNINVDTDINGMIFIPNLPPATSYHISTTKSLFSTDYTSPITLENPSPTNPDPTVLLQQVTSVTLSIDHTSILHLHAHNLGGSQITVGITGSKKIGNSPVIYKTVLSKEIIGDEILINDLEYDSYTISAPDGWFIKSCDPILPINLPPSTTSETNCYFTNNALDPRIVTISPQNSPAVANVGFEITGVNLFSNSFYLNKGGGADIIFSGLGTNLEGDSLTGNLDFSSLDIGTYDLVYQGTAGGEVRQNNAITIK